MTQKLGSADADFEQVLAVRPELLTAEVLDPYYTRERIQTVTARARFVEPDLRPLPPWSQGVDVKARIPR